MEELAYIAKELDKRIGFTGGPPEKFGSVGRDALVTMLQSGLLPTHKLLDFGCGALRLGYWFVRFMDRGNYYGIEPNQDRVEAGKEIVLGPELLAEKEPVFNNNAEYELGVFGVKFDAVIARSILTHLTPAAMQTLFESFASNSNENAFFLASYWPDGQGRSDRKVGEELMDNAAHSNINVTYKIETIEKLADQVGLKVRPLEQRRFGQDWILISR